jgi:predicted outer membrane repeat protein
MRSSASRFAALGLALALTASDAFAGGARIVDAPGLPPFYDLQDAVDAASDGDTILVAAGIYDPFTITNKSLSIVSVPGHVVFIDGPILVNNLSATRSVLLSGLEGSGKTQPSQSEPALVVTNCQGHVRIEGCKLTGGLGGPLDFSDHYGDGGHAVVLQASTQVAFAHCTLTGGRGGGDTYGCYTCTGGNGGFGVRVNLSAPAFYECTITGGAGGTTGLQGGNGGHGVWQGNTWLFAAGSSFKGGAGGNGEDYVAAWGGDGGDGLFVNQLATAELLDNTYAGGAGGKAFVFPANNGQSGAPIGGTGTVHEHLGEARHAATIRMAFDGSDLHVTVAGVPGDKVWLRVATQPAWRFQASIPGVHLVANAHLPLASAGVIPGSGSLTFSLPIADLVGQADRVLYLQALGFDAFGDAWLGSPMHALVLDLNSPPDCNGNQQSDLADTILGTSPDCGPNLVPDSCDPDCDGNNVPDDCDLNAGTHQDCNANDVPDTCDIAIGFSVDCNANGVPDDCDLASGFSPDANGNGVPDECDPNLTWWVDDDAPPGGNGSLGMPFQTIAQAMNVVIAGDEIVLRNGVYTGAGNRDVALTSSVLVRSENGPSNCVLDLDDLGRAFAVSSSAQGARVEGLKFLDGKSSGGAIYVTVSSIAVRNCIFESCMGTGRGGAIYLDRSTARIEDCIFIANSTFGSFGNGGAIYAGSTPLQPAVRVVRCSFIGNDSEEGGAIYAEGLVPLQISHSRFLLNSAAQWGGAIAARSAAGATDWVDDCLFAGNSTAGRGGAIVAHTYWSDYPTDLRVTSSTFVSNHADAEGGAISVLYNSNAAVENGIFWNNSSTLGAQMALSDTNNASLNPTLRVQRCDVQGGQAGVPNNGGTLTWAAGNLVVDPQFADPDGPDNNPLTVVDNDYRPIAGSPVNDAGDNALVPADVNDIDGDGNTTEPTPLDLDLTPRFVEDLLAPNVGAGTPPLVDMGCYER